MGRYTLPYIAWKIAVGLPRSGALPKTTEKRGTTALTTAGRKQLNVETSRWERVVRAVNQVLRPAEE